MRSMCVVPRRREGEQEGVEASDVRVMRSVHSAEEVTGDKETPQTSLLRRQADSSTEGSHTAQGW